MKRNLTFIFILVLNAAMVSAQAAPAVRRGGEGGAFSKLSVGAGVSPLGIGFEMATNLNDHFNVRGVGNVFKYSPTINTNGFAVDSNLNLASAGVMLDVYPFRSGFRLSPGVLFLNQNEITASTVVAGGTSFTLNNQDYYSANPNPATGATPVNGHGSLVLNKTSPSFVITGGWGNHIQRNGHWSFPVELGVAFIGKPQVNMSLAGWACEDAAQRFCSNIADPNDPIAIQVQDNLKVQLDKWNKDLEPLKTYPVASFGVAYSFRIR